eukprot:4648037-Pleurochrysis_carterae.AAC.1
MHARPVQAKVRRHVGTQQASGMNQHAICRRTLSQATPPVAACSRDESQPTAVAIRVRPARASAAATREAPRQQCERARSRMRRRVQARANASASASESACMRMSLRACAGVWQGCFLHQQGWSRSCSSLCSHDSR